MMDFARITPSQVGPQDARDGLRHVGGGRAGVVPAPVGGSIRLAGDWDAMTLEDPNVVALLEQMADGDVEAAATLMPLVYDRLRLLAKKLLAQESPSHTLQPTALVNEAFLRMVGQTHVDWKGKTHFFAIGARMMRRILVDHARRRLSKKRGSGGHRIELAEELCVSHRNNEDILAIDQALEKLSALDPRQAQVVELRFFGGLTVDEVAEALGVSKRTVESDWTMLRAWLRRELSGETVP